MSQVIKKYFIWFSSLAFFGICLPHFAFGADPAVPHVELTRVLEHGATETLKLRCAPDLKGTQEFFCELQRFRNGVELKTISVYSKQTKEILKSFFQILPEGALKEKAVETEREVAGLLYAWNVTYGDKTLKGNLTADKKEERRELMKAMLSLEGALSSQFFRW